MLRTRRKSKVCYNCGAQLLLNENYCPNCGQENHSRQASTRLLIKDFGDTYLSFDSKLFLTMRPLLFSPGKLTKEYLDGKRVRFVPPIRLYIFLSFIYFGVAFLLDQSTAIDLRVHDSDPEKNEAFMELFHRNVNLFILLFTPFHALLLMLLFRSEKRKYYVNFFVFTLHLFSFLFVIGIFLQLLLGAFNAFNYESNVLEIIALILELLLIGYIIYYSVKSLAVTFEKRYTLLRFIATFLLSVLTFLLTFFGYIFVLLQIAPLE